MPTAPMPDAATLAAPTLAAPTLAAPTLAAPTLAAPTLAAPTLAAPTLAAPTLAAPTLAANVLHFARLLRRAGLPVGPAETLAAQQALTRVDLASKTQARTALRTAMVHRHEHQEVFDQAFGLFWRDPTAALQAAAMALLEAQKDKRRERPAAGSRRVAEAMAPPRPPPKPPEESAGAGRRAHRLRP